MIKIYIMVAVVTLLSGVGYGGYKYVTNLQERVITLAANNVLLESAVKTSNETIRQQSENAANQARMNSELQVNLRQAESGNDALRQKLSNHDLTKLTLAKPGLIEKSINNATKDLFNQLVADTATR